jgi:Tfp pilus assembly major pilin PilA
VKNQIMQIMAIIAGPVMSTAAFAVESTANPMVLSDSQMDMVTAGTDSTPTQPATSTVTEVTQTQGDTINFKYNPTVCTNVQILPFGSGQNVGANNPQSGGVQIFP